MTYSDPVGSPAAGSGSPSVLLVKNYARNNYQLSLYCYALRTQTLISTIGKRSTRKKESQEVRQPSQTKQCPITASGSRWESEEEEE